MKVGVTTGQLIIMHQQRQQIAGSFLELIEYAKIKSFYKKNGHQVKVAVMQHETLYAEFYEIENGVPKVVDDKHVLREGKTVEEFNERLAKINNQPVTLEV